jgi:hypothetical protein
MVYDFSLLLFQLVLLRRMRKYFSPLPVAIYRTIISSYHNMIYISSYDILCSSKYHELSKTMLYFIKWMREHEGITPGEILYYIIYMYTCICIHVYMCISVINQILRRYISLMNTLCLYVDVCVFICFLYVSMYMLFR